MIKIKKNVLKIKAKQLEKIIESSLSENPIVVPKKMVSSLKLSNE
jgi:hypothetical protein